jgi:hypothetical protein
MAGFQRCSFGVHILDTQLGSERELVDGLKFPKLLLAEAGFLRGMTLPSM